MSKAVLQVLFLCTGNSARSIFAEALLNQLGQGRFQAFSAGSFPKGEVHPLALHELRQRGYSTEGLRSKSWAEFSGEGRAPLDLVITVCDNAAGETCPVWPGQPVTAHWGIEDPAAATGDDWERKAAFARAFGYLERRIELLVNLPVQRLDRLRLSQQLKEIAQSPGASSGAARADS